MPKRNYCKWTNEQKALLESMVAKQKATREQISWIQISSRLLEKTPR